MSDAVILCVDPDETARAGTIDELRVKLTGLGPTVEAARSVAEAGAILEERTVDCVVTEYDLPDGTGLDLLAHVRSVAPNTSCILFTTADHGDIDTDGFHGAITEYLHKDAQRALDRLAGLVRTTIQHGAQTSYPLPQNESERLAALRTYDLASESVRESLTRITDLAGTHFGVSRASINVLDEHSQDFLACYGGASSWERMDREESICTFTIVEDDPVMAVENVQADPRFEANETLSDLDIRAYLGASIRSPAGLAIGTLCVYDDEPRTFSGEDREYLRTLARVAMDVIEANYRAARGGSIPSDPGPGEGAGE